MNEEVTTETTETAAEPELSLAEHEEQFPGGAKPATIHEEDQPTEETAAEKEAHHSAQQAREQETGKFKEGRRRAKSQQARPADVPRINELTRQLRERDEELARLRTPPAAPSAPGSANGNGHAPAAAPSPQTPQPKAPERFAVGVPPWDPEPQETDPKFGGDFTRYLTDVSKWSARQEVRQTEFDRYVEGQQRQERESQQKELTDFATRVDSARDKHEDFDAVAFETKTPIQKGSITDTFVMRDDNGPELLYYLHAHPKELDELLKMPELGQVKFLTLLSQRLSSNSPGLIGASTTSIPGARTIVLPPKPPNVVRTEAQRASGGGPPTDRELSLSEHEHYFRPTKRR